MSRLALPFGRLASLAVGLLVVATRVEGGYLTFPPSLIEQAGSFLPISGMATIIRDQPRGYLGYIDEWLYSGQVSEPVLVVGMQLRLAIGQNWKAQPSTYSYGTSWPNVDVQMPVFEVALGKPAALVAAFGGFSSGGGTLYGPWGAYFDSDLTVVRSGPLTIPAGSFQATGGTTGVHEWGPIIPFDTPYLFTPGQALVYSVRHLGMTNASSVIPVHFASRYWGVNTTDAMISFDPNSYGPSGRTDVHYVRWVTAPVPEPSLMGILTTGGLLLLARRRRG